MSIDELSRDLEAYHCSKCEDGNGHGKNCSFYKNCIGSLYNYLKNVDGGKDYVASKKYGFEK